MKTIQGCKVCLLIKRQWKMRHKRSPRHEHNHAVKKGGNRMMKKWLFFTTSVSRKRQQLAGTNTMKKREEKNKTHKLSSHIRFNVTLRTLDKNNRQKEMPKHRKSNFQNKHRESATSNNHSIHMPTKSVIIPIKRQVRRQRSFEPASCERSEASVYDLPLLCICARRWWEAFGCQRWEITAIFQHKQMAMGWKSAILKASIWSVLRTNLIFTAYWIATDIEKGKNFTDFQKFPVKRPQRDNKNRPEKRIECWTIKT